MSRRGTAEFPELCCTPSLASNYISTSAMPTPAIVTAFTYTGCTTIPTAPGHSAFGPTTYGAADEILPGQSWTYVFEATDETIGP
jgi:hypothetical protein